MHSLGKSPNSILMILNRTFIHSKDNWPKIFHIDNQFKQNLVYQKLLVTTENPKIDPVSLVISHKKGNNFFPGYFSHTPRVAFERAH